MALCLQAAWADRDARQRVQDGEIKDMAFQMQQAQLFTALATTRIKQLNGELEPIREACNGAQAELARCGLPTRECTDAHKVNMASTPGFEWDCAARINVKLFS